MVIAIVFKAINEHFVGLLLHTYDESATVIYNSNLMLVFETYNNVVYDFRDFRNFQETTKISCWFYFCQKLVSHSYGRREARGFFGISESISVPIKFFKDFRTPPPL